MCSLQADLVVAGKVDRVFEPLAENDLQTSLALNLDLAEEIDDILRAGKGETGKDDDQGLDESDCLGGVEARSDGLEERKQEGAKPFLPGLFYELSGETADFGSRVIVDRGPEKAVDDDQAHLQARALLLVTPLEHLLVIMHQHVLDNLCARAQDLALGGSQEETGELGQCLGHQPGRKGLGAVLQNDLQGIDRELDGQGISMGNH